MVCNLGNEISSRRLTGNNLHVQCMLLLRRTSGLKMKNLYVLGLAAFMAGCTGVSSDNGGAKGYKIVQANTNAVTIQSSWGGFGDAGSALAMEHCGKYEKVAQYESLIKTGFTWRYTYLCR